MSAGSGRFFSVPGFVPLSASWRQRRAQPTRRCAHR